MQWSIDRTISFGHGRPSRRQRVKRALAHYQLRCLGRQARPSWPGLGLLPGRLSVSELEASHFLQEGVHRGQAEHLNYSLCTWREIPAWGHICPRGQAGCIFQSDQCAGWRSTTTHHSRMICRRTSYASKCARRIYRSPNRRLYACAWAAIMASRYQRHQRQREPAAAQAVGYSPATSQLRAQPIKRQSKMASTQKAVPPIPWDHRRARRKLSNARKLHFDWVDGQGALLKLLRSLPIIARTGLYVTAGVELGTYTHTWILDCTRFCTHFTAPAVPPIMGGWEFTS